MGGYRIEVWYGPALGSDTNFLQDRLMDVMCEGNMSEKPKFSKKPHGTAKTAVPPRPSALGKGAKNGVPAPLPADGHVMTSEQQADSAIVWQRQMRGSMAKVTP